MVVIKVTETPGVCRWCGCSEYNACPAGCGWANRQQTLCTECVDIDKAIRTKAGRRDVADTFHIGKDASR